MKEDAETLSALEARLADLWARMPAHSARPAMLIEMEELEDEIDELRTKLRQAGKADA